MKNRILFALAIVALSFNVFAQAAPQQVTVTPTGEAMLYLLKGIKMNHISNNWSNAHAWMQSTAVVTDAVAASKLMNEFSGNISDDALQPTFKAQKTKWAKSNAKVSSNTALKQSLKDFAAGIDPAAFIPEFNMAEWNLMVDKL